MALQAGSRIEERHVLALVAERAGLEVGARRVFALRALLALRSAVHITVESLRSETSLSDNSRARLSELVRPMQE